jgi:hypothetical protein
MLTEVLLIANPEFEGTVTFPVSVAPPRLVIVRVFSAEVFAATDPKDSTVVEREIHG